MDKCLILKDNSDEIRTKIREAGIYVCPCAEFAESDWLHYHTTVANGVHGDGYAFEGMTREETRALFLHEVKNPVWCNDVEEFVKRIKAFENEHYSGRLVSL